MIKSTAQRDIENWAIERLAHWVIDVHDRFKIIGLSPEYSNQFTAITLMRGAAGLIAIRSDSSPENAGEAFAEIIESMRKEYGYE